VQPQWWQPTPPAFLPALDSSAVRAGEGFAWRRNLTGRFFQESGIRGQESIGLLLVGLLIPDS
jgi:hypothetical protein